MRSCVRCGIDFAAGERLMTSDTVAGESPRCSARNFRLTDGAEEFPRGRDDVTIFDRGMGCFVRVVCHKHQARASNKAKFFASICASLPKRESQKPKKNRFIMG